MKAIVALVGMMLVALAGTARGQDAIPCDDASRAFTRGELEHCLKTWRAADIPDFEKKRPNLTNLSAKNIGDLMRALQELSKTRDAAEALATAEVEALTTNKAEDEALNKATDKADAAAVQARRAESLESAAMKRREVTMEIFGKLDCHNDLFYCVDRYGEPYAPHESEKKPTLLAGDTLFVIVISDAPNDIGTIVLRAENARRVGFSFPPKVTDTGSSTDVNRTSGQPTEDAQGQPTEDAPREVARLTIATETDVARVVIKMKRVGQVDDKEILNIPITGRRHYIEFGLMLPFAYQREVTPQGAVKYGMEPDLAFTITVFPGARSSSEPWQSRKRSWFGLMAGADLTNEVSDKRYYLGLDFSPVSGLALNAGLAILPWEYVPNPEQVPDVLTGDIEPDQRYRASFFFGARMTPEVFDTVKAAYKALNQ